jgi:ATP-dependent Clp protease ATP-binding subunit ClpB
VNFTNTVIILTSNLGSEFLAALPEGASSEDARTQVMDVVRHAFRPEFLNRLDEIILFNRLQQKDMAGIVNIQLALLEKRLSAQQIEMKVDENAQSWLAKEGYDAVYGARPLKRVVQKQVQNKLAEMILEGALLPHDIAAVSAGKDGITISAKKGKASKAA